MTTEGGAGCFGGKDYAVGHSGYANNDATTGGGAGAAVGSGGAAHDDSGDWLHRRTKKEKGYAHLDRLSSEEELLHVKSKPKKTVFGKLIDKGKDKETKSKQRSKSKLSKSKGPDSDASPASVIASYCRPVFGVPIADALRNNPSYDRVPVPAFARQCIDYILENGVTLEGIYRISPPKSVLEELKTVVGSGEEPCFPDAHHAACLLKLFIRELPEPLLTESLLPKFEEAATKCKSIAECLGRLNELIERLPKPNKFFLAYFFLHLQEIIQNSDKNKMTVANLGVILLPLLNISQALLNVLLQNPRLLFPNVRLKKYISPLKPDSGRSAADIPTDPREIVEELAKQEFLLSHLHDEIKSGICDPQKEEQLWDVQRLVTQLKRKLKVLKKCNDGALDGLKTEPGPCLEMFEEKHLIAVHMDLRNKIDGEQKSIEALLSQIRDAKKAVTSPIDLDPPLTAEEEGVWMEKFKEAEQRKYEIIENVIAERQKCVLLLAEMEMLSLQSQKRRSQCYGSLQY